MYQSKTSLHSNHDRGHQRVIKSYHILPSLEGAKTPASSPRALKGARHLFIADNQKLGDLMNMKHFITLAVILISIELSFTACSTNPNKAKDIDTKLENTSAINGETSLGIKDGYMVVQKKVMMNEELRKLQYEVYELEDRVYGNRKYGSLGLYGVLRDCRMQLSDTKNGGDGKLKWTEPIDRVTDKEEEFKIGLDEEKKLVGVSEEFLADRIKRFKSYQNILNKREDEYEEKVAICKADLKARKN